MLSLLLNSILAATATATQLQDTSLISASQFTGHNSTQSPLAALGVLHGLLNRQSTCDPGYGLCPGGGCCPLADNCCTNSDFCVQAGGECCSDNTHTCPPGWNCCVEYCSPVNGQCCTTGYYCPDDSWCVLYSGEQFCCYDLTCLGTYNPQYVAVPTITAPNLQVPTNAAGGSGSSVSGGPEASSTNLPPSTTEPPSATTAVVYQYYYFTITWSYTSSYYPATDTVDYEYTWQIIYTSTTVSFYCSDYADASYSASEYSETENFPTPTNAALPSFTNSMATATTTATGSAGAGGSSSGPVAGALSQWQGCTSRYLGLIFASCLLLNLVLF